jgi:hypothetical protein
MLAYLTLYDLTPGLIATEGWHVMYWELTYLMLSFVYLVIGG